MDDTSPHLPIALVPLRTGGKSRLAAALPADVRDRLVLAMLDDVVAALRSAGIDDVRVLAGNDAARSAAEARGLAVIVDPPDAEPVRGARGGDARLRAAVDAGLAAVGTTAIRLVIAADLPRLTGTEIARALDEPAEVVVAPTTGGGTALLRLAPGVTLPTRYGRASAAAHVEAAAAAGVSVTLLDLAGARHDVDGAGDLSALREELDGVLPGPATTSFLAGVRG